MYTRTIEAQIIKQLKKGKSLLLLGPRQVGKTTICKKQQFDEEINLASLKEKHRYEKDPELLEKLVQSKYKNNKKVKVYIDEIQKIPELFNSVQVLIDEKKAQFILTGSSARKIKTQMDVNFSPGRLINFKIDPLSFIENDDNLDAILTYGQLPAISKEKNKDQKELELRSYVENYIEEEIRKETRLRSIAPFARFIELAALQSGRIVNFSEISQELGPTVVTIQSYYQILEDTLFATRIPPYLKNASRKKLTKASKYLFFDMGVRRILADESTKLTPDRKGEMFEHWIGNEIIKWININQRTSKLFFWRDSDGPELDWLIEYDGNLLPIEVKLNQRPKNSSIKHLKTFMREYKKADTSLVICTTEIMYQLEKNITVIPFQDLHHYLDRWANIQRGQK
jgi:predicted AAA+ superfamily ATPase